MPAPLDARDLVAMGVMREHEVLGLHEVELGQRRRRARQPDGRYEAPTQAGDSIGHARGDGAAGADEPKAGPLTPFLGRGSVADLGGRFQNEGEDCGRATWSWKQNPARAGPGAPR